MARRSVSAVRTSLVSKTSCSSGLNGRTVAGRSGCARGRGSPSPVRPPRARWPSSPGSPRSCAGAAVNGPVRDAGRARAGAGYSSRGAQRASSQIASSSASVTGSDVKVCAARTSVNRAPVRRHRAPAGHRDTSLIACRPVSGPSTCIRRPITSGPRSSGAKPKLSTTERKRVLESRSSPA